MRLLARDGAGRRVVVEIDHDELRRRLTPHVVDGLLATLDGHPVDETFVVPCRVVSVADAPRGPARV